jgi:Uma2 family endonuclease
MTTARQLGGRQENTMARTVGLALADHEPLPDDGKRYEIIDGELYVSQASDWRHQLMCFELGWSIHRWDPEDRLGLMLLAPGVVFATEDDVAPDVVWISRERLSAVLGADGKLHAAPDLVMEVLSPGTTNERRDREAKLKLYSRRGVAEYWILSWQHRTVEVYRREDAALRLVATLYQQDSLSSPLLPGFNCQLGGLFNRIPEIPGP